jgi:hypothetical protein
MSEKLNTVIMVIGTDIGKNSFHVVGLDKRGAIVLQQKWSRGQVENTARQHSALPDRHGSLRRCASSQSQAQDAWSGRRAQHPTRNGVSRSAGSVAYFAVHRETHGMSRADYVSGSEFWPNQWGIITTSQIHGSRTDS